MRIATEDAFTCIGPNALMTDVKGWALRTSAYRDSEPTDELLLYILLAITGMLGPYVLL
jgi:hypothetical protein